MDPKDYCRIKSHYILLVSCLTEIVDKVTEDFLKNDILTAKQKKRINQKKTNEKKSKALLDRMLDRGNLQNEDKIYQVLCETLVKEKCVHVKHMLEDTVMPEERDGEGSGDKLEEDTETDAPVGDESGDECEEDQKAGAQAAGNIENRQILNIGNIYTHCSDIHIGPRTVYNFCVNEDDTNI